MRLRVKPITVSEGILWCKKRYTVYAIQEFQLKTAPKMMSLGEYPYMEWTTLATYPTLKEAQEHLELLKQINEANK